MSVFCGGGREYNEDCKHKSNPAFRRWTASTPEETSVINTPSIVLTEPVRQFLLKPLTATLSVIDHDGFPHSIPLWFDVDGGDLLLISHRNNQSVEFARSRGTVIIGATNCEAEGYVFTGEIMIERKPDYQTLKRIANRYEGDRQVKLDVAEWLSNPNLTLIRFAIETAAPVA